MGLKTIIAAAALLGALASPAPAAEAGRRDRDVQRGPIEAVAGSAGAPDQGPVVRLLHPLGASWARWSRRAWDGLVLPAASRPAPTPKAAPPAAVRSSVHPLVAAGLPSPGFGYDLFFPGRLGPNPAGPIPPSHPVALPGSPQRWAVFSAWPAGGPPSAPDAAQPVRRSEPERPAELLLAVRAGF